MAAPPDEVDPAAVVPLAGFHGNGWHLGDHAVLLPEGTTHRTLLAARLDDLLFAKPAEGAARRFDNGCDALVHTNVQVGLPLSKREQAAAMVAVPALLDMW